MQFIDSGVTHNIQWTIEGREAVDKRFYAIVTVGSTRKITENTYRTQEGAKSAGEYLRDKTLAEQVRP